MRQQFEDDVPIAGAVAVPAQCREAQRMRGVVGQIESALERERIVECALQPGICRALEFREFLPLGESTFKGLPGPLGFFQGAESFSPPTIQTLGCSSSRVRKDSCAFTRLASSLRVRMVGLTVAEPAACSL
jgi:hypothetical protein